MATHCASGRRRSTGDAHAYRNHPRCRRACQGSRPAADVRGRLPHASPNAHGAGHRTASLADFVCCSSRIPDDDHVYAPTRDWITIPRTSMLSPRSMLKDQSSNRIDPLRSRSDDAPQASFRNETFLRDAAVRETSSRAAPFVRKPPLHAHHRPYRARRRGPPLRGGSALAIETAFVGSPRTCKPCSRSMSTNKGSSALHSSSATASAKNHRAPRFAMTQWWARRPHAGGASGSPTRGSAARNRASPRALRRRSMRSRREDLARRLVRVLEDILDRIAGLGVARRRGRRPARSTRDRCWLTIRPFSYNDRRAARTV